MKCDKDIVYNSEKDEFYVKKNITIEIPVLGSKLRKNCYDCLFCKELTGYENAKYKTKPDEYGKYLACALNPTQSIHLQLDFPRNWVCPLNEAIKKAFSKN